MTLQAVPDLEDDEEDVEMAKNSLADAAQDALDGEPVDGGQPGEQTALVPACKVKFQGVSYDSIEEVPNLKDTVTFIVTGRVVGHEEKVFADGDIRTIVKVDATDVKPYKGDVSG